MILESVMMPKKFLILIGLISLLAPGLAACGDDGGDPTDADAGDAVSNDAVSDIDGVTLSVRGEMEREREGTAEFKLFKSDEIGIWLLSMKDESPRTFTLSIQDMAEPWRVGHPEPGTYPIGHSLDTALRFEARYRHIGDYDLPYQYGYQTGHEVGGTLTIETSTETQISGSFEFRAIRRGEDVFADEPGGEIEVSGRFVAHEMELE